MKTPEMHPEVADVALRFRDLIQDRTVRGGLDALASDVLERCDEFFSEHHDAIRQLCPSASPEHLVSAVCGWILGFAAGKQPTTEGRIAESFQHNALAAYVSAWSMENAARVWRRS